MYKRWEPQSRKLNARAWLRWLKKAKTWQLLILLILVAFISATFLRLNNIGMIELRKEVLKADKQNDAENTKSKLIELQGYVSGHMNTDMGKGIELEHSYRRDYNKAIEAAVNAHNTNSDVYQKASLDCRGQFQGGASSFRNDYVTCVQNKVAELSPDQQQETNLPILATYRYNFATPLFSLDLAGFFLSLAILLALFILLRWIALFALRIVIKKRAKIV